MNINKKIGLFLILSIVSIFSLTLVFAFESFGCSPGDPKICTDEGIATCEYGDGAGSNYIVFPSDECSSSQICDNCAGTRNELGGELGCHDDQDGDGAYPDCPFGTTMHDCLDFQAEDPFTGFPSIGCPTIEEVASGAGACAPIERRDCAICVQDNCGGSDCDAECEFSNDGDSCMYEPWEAGSCCGCKCVKKYGTKYAPFPCQTCNNGELVPKTGGPCNLFSSPEDASCCDGVCQYSFLPCSAVSSASTTSLNSQSFYQARRSSESVINQIAYQIMPSGINFNVPAQLTLLYNGQTFQEGDGIYIYKYEDSFFQRV